jgi:hypothetical protein
MVLREAAQDFAKYFAIHHEHPQAAINIGNSL